MADSPANFKYFCIMKLAGNNPDRRKKLKKFLLVYYGGKMETDPKKAKESTAAWMKWFQDMGKSVADMGAATMPGKMVSGKTTTKITGEAVTGYSVLQADDLDGAAALAKKSPQITSGGSIAIYEILPM